MGATHGEVLAAELDAQRGPRAFVHEPGGFEPILQQQGGETFLCVNDHLGMPKDLVSGDGLVVWTAAHSAYGRVIAVDADLAAKARYGESASATAGARGTATGIESAFRLLGQVADEDAELGWTRFRCFDAESGRWLSPDPLGLDGGLNLSGLNGAPPLVVDPLGLSEGTATGDPHDPWSREPKSVQDKMALDAAKEGAGTKIIDNLGDERLKGMEKWEYKVKSADGKDSVVHYVRDPATGSSKTSNSRS